MDLERFCAASRVVIVAGKGGVGKTTVTAALASAAAAAGMSVLIVEVEGKSGLAACFGEAPLTYEDAELRPGLRARTLTPDDALLEYLDDHGMRRISRRLSRSGALDVISTAVPGMRDILVLGKVKQLERAGVADLIVLDAPAAGHAVSFLLSARGLLDAVKVGPVNRQAADVVELLTDPERCRVMLVTLPEETPVNELVETAYAIEDRAGVALGPVVVNACMPVLAGLRSDPALARSALLRAGDGSGTSSDAASGGVSPGLATALADAESFRAGIQEREGRQCARLAERLPLPQLRLPYLFTSELGPLELGNLATALAAGIADLDEGLLP
jgi:anion-transporting  ArsA/GET3 family ATPase